MLPWGACETQVSIAVGCGLGPRPNRVDFKPRPYLNVDFRPTTRAMKTVVVASSLARGESVNARPSWKASKRRARFISFRSFPRTSSLVVVSSLFARI